MPLAAGRAPPAGLCAPRATVVRAAKAAAPAAVAAAQQLAWFTATGVPLVETLRVLTLQQAAVRCAVLVIATAVGVAFGNKLLDLAGAQMESVAERTRRSSGLPLLMGTALAAVHRPAKLLLPTYGFFYTLLVLTAFTEVALTHMDAHMHTVLHLCGSQVLGFFKSLAQVTQDTSELLLIVFAAWFLIAWKDKVVEIATTNLQEGEMDGPNFARVLVPLSNVATWGIVIAASLTTLTAFGINVQPLLAFGSISTVAVGFAAQSTMQNVVSALQIYSSRPFIVGDRIQLKSLSGSLIAAGVVESVAPMRTVLRADNKLPVFIPNKDVMNLVVVNENKMRRASVQPKMPLIEATLTLRYCDVDALPAVEAAIGNYLDTHPLVDPAISSRCVLTEFTPLGPQLALRALLVKSAAGRQAAVRSELLREAERLVRQHGAYLATDCNASAGLPAMLPLPPLPRPGVSGEFGTTPAGP
ncbi:mechanosensitive ion channel isoform A [Micractinium conductrix]|uniref:Mechanosensitive ion channel isoform A n=1 Tax=Micractinium conductrix TaxID=554055 RepID=A0A2P6VS94_9CHLO|nr:mechanosensitive ion channel isoform A [Micractinium conductrix]|eukprot:PSC76963.1 mechanosensitive ion channel isoform A [Micractinium conductrix]